MCTKKHLRTYSLLSMYMFFSTCSSLLEVPHSAACPESRGLRINAARCLVPSSVTGAEKHKWHHVGSFE